jgi:hypothetical protein
MASKPAPKQPAAPPPEPEDDDVVEATVRRGTVVWGGTPDTYKDTGQLDARGGRIMRRLRGEEPTHSGPGEKVQLAYRDVKRLRASGALVDPGTPDIPVGLGPSFNNEDGSPAPSVEVQDR